MLKVNLLGTGLKGFTNIDISWKANKRVDLEKKPGVAETLDWARALMGIGVRSIDENPEALRNTLLCLLKTRSDREAMVPEVVDRLVAKAV